MTTPEEVREIMRRIPYSEIPAMAARMESLRAERRAEIARKHPAPGK